MAIFGSHDLIDTRAIVPDPGDTGALPANGGFVSMAPAGAETRTLAAPLRAFVTLFLVQTTTFLNVVTIATGYDVAGSTDLNFTQAGEFAYLKSEEIAPNTFRWRLISSSGALVAQTETFGAPPPGVPVTGAQNIAAFAGEKRVVIFMGDGNTVVVPPVPTVTSVLDVTIVMPVPAGGNRTIDITPPVGVTIQGLPTVPIAIVLNTSQVTFSFTLFATAGGATGNWNFI